MQGSSGIFFGSYHPEHRQSKSPNSKTEPPWSGVATIAIATAVSGFIEARLEPRCAQVGAYPEDNDLSVVIGTDRDFIGGLAADVPEAQECFIGMMGWDSPEIGAARVRC